MIEFPDIINAIIGQDSSTLWISLVLALFAGVIVKSMTDSTSMAVSFTPIIYFGALTGVHLCRDFGLILLPQKQGNTIASACLGMIVTLVFMLLATRIAYAYTSTRRSGLEERIKDDGSNAYNVRQRRLPQL